MIWNNLNKYEITNKQKHQFSHHGVVLLKGLFTNLIELIAVAIDQNLASPGPYADENLLSNQSGRLFMVTATGKDCQP